MTDSHYIKKYILSLGFFTVPGLLALLLPAPTPVRVLLTILYLLGVGLTVGRRLLPHENDAWPVFLGTLYHLSAIIVTGGLVYFLLDLSTTSLVLTLVLSSALSAISVVWRKDSVEAFEPQDRPTTIHSSKKWWRTPLNVGGFLGAIALFLLALYGLGLLSGAATELSVRSPWDDVPRLFFILVFLVGAGLLALSSGRLSGLPVLLPLMTLGAMATTVAVSVYSVGFGFDPFIHQATELHIFRFGEMFPKPPYYLGQYALVTILAKMAGGHLIQIDKWLVPLGFSLCLPLAYWSLRRTFAWSGYTAAAASFGLLLLPLSPFILTTPQGLANLFSLFAALTCLPTAVDKGIPWRLPLSFALAATAIHPLAGVPLLLFVLLIGYLRASFRFRHRRSLRWGIFTVLTLLTAVCLPVLFMVNSRLSGNQVSLEGSSISAPAAIIEAFQTPELLSRRFSATLDFTYGWRNSRTALLGLLGSFGLLLLWLNGRRKNEPRRQEAAIAYAAGALALLTNFVLLRTWISFPFLIDYERNNYADRLGDLTLLLLAPLVIYLIGSAFRRIRSHGFPTLAAGAILLLAATVTANVYLAYPRRDRYESSRGWSTSMADLNAVRTIDRQADEGDYVVLANQSVSAAAIRELGFKKYFRSADDEEIFFYPVPTGGSLYSVFLDLNEDLGRRRTAERAFDLTGVDEVYYVVDHYWWQAQQIILNAKKESDDWWQEGDRVWVFRYDK